MDVTTGFLLPGAVLFAHLSLPVLCTTADMWWNMAELNRIGIKKLRRATLLDLEKRMQIISVQSCT